MSFELFKWIIKREGLVGTPEFVLSWSKWGWPWESPSFWLVCEVRAILWRTLYSACEVWPCSSQSASEETFFFFFNTDQREWVWIGLNSALFTLKQNKREIQKQFLSWVIFSLYLGNDYRIERQFTTNKTEQISLLI